MILVWLFKGDVIMGWLRTARDNFLATYFAVREFLNGPYVTQIWNAFMYLLYLQELGPINSEEVEPLSVTSAQTNSENEKFKHAVQKIYLLILLLIAFTALERTRFGHKLVEENPIVMRLLLVFTVTTFLILILTSLFQYPPVSLLKYVILMVIACVICFWFTLQISPITSLLVLVIWIVGLSTMIFTQEHTTIYVGGGGNKVFKFVSNIMFTLPIFFVTTEILGIFEEKPFFTMSFVLVSVVVSTFLIIIIPYILKKSPVCDLLETIVLMVMTCVLCVLLVLLISTVTAVLVFIVWMAGIMIVVVKMWDDLVQQMKAIKNVVDNEFN